MGRNDEQQGGERPVMEMTRVVSGTDLWSVTDREPRPQFRVLEGGSRAERIEAFADAWSTTRGMVWGAVLGALSWGVVLTSAYTLVRLAAENYEAAAWISFGAILIATALAMEFTPRLARWAWSWVRS